MLAHIVPAGTMLWHGTSARSRMDPRRLRGPMWFARARGRTLDFGPRTHCYSTLRPLRLYPLDRGTSRLPLDWSILLPRERTIAALRSAGYDGSVLYLNDPSEEIMLLQPTSALRRCTRQ